MALLEPQQPIDWVSSLEKIYARQTRQTEEHYARLTARDEQDLKKKKNESFITQLEALSKFSTTVGKAKSAIDKASEKKKAGELLADQVEFRKNNPDLKLTEKYLDNYNALEKDQVDLSKEIKEAIKNKKIAPELGYAILEGHGTKVLKYSKLMAYEKLNRSISDLNTKLNDPANEEFQAEFRSQQLAGNTKRFYEKYIYGELSELGLKDSWVKDNLQKTIEKYTNTKGVLNSINVKDVQETLSDKRKKYMEMMAPGMQKRMIYDSLAAASEAFGKGTGNTGQTIANAITAAAKGMGGATATYEKARLLAIEEDIKKGIAEASYKPTNTESLINFYRNIKDKKGARQYSESDIAGILTSKKGENLDITDFLRATATAKLGHIEHARWQQRNNPDFAGILPENKKGNIDIEEAKKTMVEGKIYFDQSKRMYVEKVIKDGVVKIIPAAS